MCVHACTTAEWQRWEVINRVVCVIEHVNKPFDGSEMKADTKKLPFLSNGFVLYFFSVDLVSRLLIFAFCWRRYCRAVSTHLRRQRISIFFVSLEINIYVFELRCVVVILFYFFFRVPSSSSSPYRFQLFTFDGEQRLQSKIWKKNKIQRNLRILFIFISLSHFTKLFKQTFYSHVAPLRRSTSHCMQARLDSTMLVTDWIMIVCHFSCVICGRLKSHKEKKVRLRLIFQCKQRSLGSYLPYRN